MDLLRNLRCSFVIFFMLFFVVDVAVLLGIRKLLDQKLLDEVCPQVL